MIDNKGIRTFLNVNTENNRIIVIDDNLDIHNDIRKLLELQDSGSDKTEKLDELNSVLFGEQKASQSQRKFEVDFCSQGEDGIQRVLKSVSQNKPYAMAMVDIRMPPGIDGIQTTKRLWEIDPDLQIAICSAYSDYSWEMIVDELGFSEKLCILKKPFERTEMLQMIHTMCHKWALSQQAELKMDQLEKMAKELAAESEKANQILMAEIEQHKLTEKKLTLANELAESAIKARREFLANMSHELRTPLNCIIGLSQILDDSPLDEEQREHLASIEQSGSEMLGLVSNILDFSKVDTGKLEIQAVDFAPKLLIERIIRTEIPQDKHHLEIKFLYDPRIPEVINGDPNRLRQALTSLFSNSIKFTQTGSIEISVVLESESEETVNLCFQVKDTGIGFDETVKAKIGEPFFQADMSNTRKYGGCGIGLSITQRIIKLMDGEMQFESEEGKGSRFWFSAPFNKPI